MQKGEGVSPVKVWCEFRGMEVASLAKASGLSPDYIAKVEAGKRHLNDQQREALAAALGILPLDLTAPSFGGCCWDIAGVDEE